MRFLQNLQPVTTLYFPVGLIYVTGINILLFVLMGIDKRRAKKKQWRLRESTLFKFCLLGGGVGGILGMLFFHHKTKHMKFVLGFPMILAAESAIMYYCLMQT